MADLDAQIKALEEQVAAEQQSIERDRQARVFAAQSAGPLFSTPPVAQSTQSVQADGSAPPKKIFEKDADERSIFIQGLPKGNETPEQLAAFFADCGPILKCTVLKDKHSGALKGSAYIEFATHEATGRAIDTKQNVVFQGSTLTVCKTFRVHTNKKRWIVDHQKNKKAIKTTDRNNQSSEQRRRNANTTTHSRANQTRHRRHVVLTLFVVIRANTKRCFDAHCSGPLRRLLGNELFLCYSFVVFTYLCCRSQRNAPSSILADPEVAVVPAAQIKQRR